MAETIQRLLDLFSQLLEIGLAHPEVLVASVVFAIVVVIAVTAVVCTVLLCVPITIVYWIVHFFKWIYWLVYPDRRPVDDYEDYDEFSEEEKQGTKDSEQDKMLDPVYPDWMNKKGGRLL